MTDTDERLDAYHQIVSRRPDDGYRRGSTVTQAGAPDRHERWRALAGSFLAYVLIDRDDGPHPSV
jgi:hypothetical protein